MSTQERVRDWRPTWRLNNTDPVASNFYPMTAAIEIAQPGHSALAVLTDRAQGEMCLARMMLLDSCSGSAHAASGINPCTTDCCIVQHSRSYGPHENDCMIMESSRLQQHVYHLSALTGLTLLRTHTVELAMPQNGAKSPQHRAILLQRTVLMLHGDMPPRLSSPLQGGRRCAAGRWS